MTADHKCRFVLAPGGATLDCVHCDRSLPVEPEPLEPAKHVPAGSGIRFPGSANSGRQESAAYKPPKRGRPAKG